MIAWLSLAHAADLCPLVLPARPDIAAVARALEAGAEVNAPCTWSEEANGLSTVGGVLLAVTVPVLGAILAHRQKRTVVRRATPLQLAVTRGDQGLFDVLVPLARMDDDLVDTALSGGHHRMVAKLIEQGADPNVTVLGGPATTSAKVLRQMIDAGAKLDQVSMVFDRGAVDVAWVDLALEAGIRPSLFAENAMLGGTEPFFRVIAQAPDARMDLLARAVREGRSDLLQAAVTRGVSLEGPPQTRTLLMEAAAAGDVRLVQRLLGWGADVRAVDADGRTALHDAVLYSTALLPLLTDAGIDVIGKEGSALAEALGSERLPFATALLARGAKIDDQAVVEAVGELPSLRLLFAHGLDPAWTSSTGRSLAVQIIAGRGEVAMLQEAARRGAPLNGSTPETSAVHAALRHYKREQWIRAVVAAGGDLSTCPDVDAVWKGLYKLEPELQAWLLAHGLPPGQHLLVAAVEARDPTAVTDLLGRGLVPGAEAFEELFGYSKIHPQDVATLEALLTVEFDLDQRLSMGRSAVHLAYDRERWDLLTVLAANGADLNAPGFAGRTLLTDALSEGPEVVSEILALGADPDAPDGNGRSPLSVAIAGDHHAAAALLLAAGARSEPCVAGVHAVPCAIEVYRDGQTDLLHTLLAGGADPNAVDVFGNTLLALALQKGDLETVDALVDAGVTLTSSYVHDLMRRCDVQRARATRDRWPEDVRPLKTAARAGCKAQLKPIVLRR